MNKEQGMMNVEFGIRNSGFYVAICHGHIILNEITEKKFE
jgi:hypothetical protein